MAWISVTKNFDQQPIFINLDQVLTVKPDGKGAKVHFNAALEGKPFVLPVVESYDSVTKKIQQQALAAA